MVMQQDRVSKHGRWGARELQTVFLIQIVSCCRRDQGQGQDQDQPAADTHAAHWGTHDGAHTTEQERETRVSFITRSPQTQTYPDSIQTLQKLSFQTLMGILRDVRKQMLGLASYLSQEIITISPPLQFKRASHYLVFWQEKQLVEQTEYNTLCPIAHNFSCEQIPDFETGGNCKQGESYPFQFKKQQQLTPLILLRCSFNQIAN